MIKSELIASIAKSVKDLPEKKVVLAINYMLDSMGQALVKGQRIEVRGFGSFTLHHRPARNAHNPKTGKKLVTLEKFSPHFKPGKELRERVDVSRAKYSLKKD